MASFQVRFLGAALGCYGLLCGAAPAQDLTGANGGLNSDNGALSGATIDRVNGINANGTPRQQDPGASITNGAGNSTMTPGVSGPVMNNSGAPALKTVPPTAIVHGSPTGNSQ